MLTAKRPKHSVQAENLGHTCLIPQASMLERVWMLLPFMDGQRSPTHSRRKPVFKIKFGLKRDRGVKHKCKDPCRALAWAR